MMRATLLFATPLLLLAACKGQEPAKRANAAASAAGTPAVGGAPPMQGDPAKNPDMTGFAKEVDANGDGRMSRAEWQAKTLPESSFNLFEKGRGYVTLEDYQANPAPPGIDIDGDGRLTVTEFKEFDRKMSAQMTGDGKAPPKP